VVGNSSTNQGNSTFAGVMKGVPNASGVRVWSVLARTEPYPASRTAFDHLCSGIVVSPDGNYIYFNSGSRTDHGEVESISGLYPNLRETGLTAKILRLPANGNNLVLTNDINVLRSAAYVFAEGTRNAFDLAFGPNGELFATDNGPDRDMSDELNWIRPGMHYGFPWRMGGADNPQQFPNYDPSQDLLLDSRYIAVARGTYQNDPTFPAPPTNFAEPVINLGPDADSYRDATDGSVKDASTLGQTISTFTPHRSPLGLVFDNTSSMAPPFQQHGFMLSWTPGDPNGDSVAGPFLDASQDMVDLELTKLGTTNYQSRVTRIVSGFSKPIDAEILGNKIYVIEYSGNQGIWEITFPAAKPAIPLSDPTWLANRGFSFIMSTLEGQNYTVEVSSNLSEWFALTNFVATSNQFLFLDEDGTNHLSRFYRARSP
jgi:glucose/arabinose dehydrogenase